MSPRFEDPLEKIRQAQEGRSSVGGLPGETAASPSPRGAGLTREARELLAARFPELKDEAGYSGEEEESLLPPILEEDRMLSGLSYLAWFLVPPIILLSDKKNEPYVRFHALQGLFTGLAVSLASLVMLIFAWLFSLILARAEMAGGVIYVIIISVIAFLHLVLLGLVAFFAWRAHNGRYFRLPILAGLADHFTPESFQRF
jgi:uncharacterized membrane protein